ncbi:hypothetical protein Agub_g14236, partial [Astrephomene gubernaculifera]
MLKSSVNCASPTHHRSPSNTRRNMSLSGIWVALSVRSCPLASRPLACVMASARTMLPASPAAVTSSRFQTPSMASSLRTAVRSAQCTLPRFGMSMLSSHPRRHTAPGLLRALATETAAAGVKTATVDNVSETAADPNGQVQTVLLEVGGMKCGGCSAAVKRMLSGRPEVAAAAVNLLTETAAVQVRGSPEELGPALAAFISARGFPARVRSAAAADDEGEDGTAAADPLGLAAAEEADRKRQADARRSLLDLSAAWLLVAACVAHHSGHLLHAAGHHEVAHLPLLAALADPRVSGALGAFALLGPGRRLLVDGFRSLVSGHPNMNSLVG